MVWSGIAKPRASLCSLLTCPGPIHSPSLPFASDRCVPSYFFRGFSLRTDCCGHYNMIGWARRDLTTAEHAMDHRGKDLGSTLSVTVGAAHSACSGCACAFIDPEAFIEGSRVVFRVCNHASTAAACKLQPLVPNSVQGAMSNLIRPWDPVYIDFIHFHQHRQHCQLANCYSGRVVHQFTLCCGYIPHVRPTACVFWHRSA